MKTTTRKIKGSTLAEFGPALLLAFTVFLFPLWAFGTIGMRFCFLMNAARLASQSAARAQSFLTDIDPLGTPPTLSAVHIAQKVASMACNNIGGKLGPTQGVTLNTTSVYIKVCPSGGTEAAYSPQPAVNTALSQPAQPASYTYNCEVILDGTVQPLLPNWSGFLGANIPGLNAPIRTEARSDCFFENTTNLNL